MTDKQRKADHLTICLEKDVSFGEKTTLFEEVELLHDAVTDSTFSEINLSTTLFGKKLKAPIVIAAMTGGTPEAQTINRTLARVAETRGYALGLGSQKIMLKDASTEDSFLLRDFAPTALIFSNLGAVFARDLPATRVLSLLEKTEADALCIHLNAAMELIQAEGDRDFSNLSATLRRLQSDSPVPIIAKETGCGISKKAAQKLIESGIRHVDVSGAGGTSWVAVESHRTESKSQQALAHLLRDWGIPTAASTAICVNASFETVIATGGISSGLDVAKALVLGAEAAGIARPVLQALHHHGENGLHDYFDRMEHELRCVMMLLGVKGIKDLERQPRILGPKLQEWIRA